MQDAFRRLALDVIMEAGFGIKTDAMLPTAASAKNELLTQMDNAPWYVLLLLPFCAQGGKPCCCYPSVVRGENLRMSLAA